MLSYNTDGSRRPNVPARQPQVATRVHRLQLLATVATGRPLARSDPRIAGVERDVGFLPARPPAQHGLGDRPTCIPANDHERGQQGRRRTVADFATDVASRRALDRRGGL